MPKFSVTRPRELLGAPAIFDVVADVESYKEFLPLVERIDVLATFAGGELMAMKSFSAELVIATRKWASTKGFSSQV